MRFYNITITSPTTGAIVRPAAFASLNLPASYTSFVNNKTLGGALDIEMDIPISAFAQPAGSGWLRIHGISIAEVSQANNLNGFNIAVYGGMQKGLPLAKPALSGLLAQGTIFQAFGNWIGTDMTLELIFYPPVGTPEAPKNIVFNWKRGTPLNTAIQQTLATAFPDFKTTFNISPKLVLANDEHGFYSTLPEFAPYLKQMSAAIVGGNYQGVDIQCTQKTFSVYDGTVPTAPKLIAFEDMIGQPTWLSPTTVSVKFVMRADLAPGDFIQFPPALTTQNADSVSPLVAAKSTFAGVFLISSVRSVGAFRQADPSSWVTVVEAAATQPVSS